MMQQDRPSRPFALLSSSCSRPLALLLPSSYSPPLPSSCATPSPLLLLLQFPTPLLLFTSSLQITEWEYCADQGAWIYKMPRSVELDEELGSGRAC